MPPRVLNSLLIPLLSVMLSTSLLAQKDGQTDELRELAGGGDAEAQFKLGNQYFYGEGRLRNYTIAALWYRKAAQQGNAGAQFNLGICYDNGMGVPRSRFHAFEWYKKAAESGIKPAMLNTAITYINGLPAEGGDDPTPPVYPDRDKARKLLDRLMAERYIPAWREMANWYLGMDGDERDRESDAKAFQLASYAAGKGDAEAMRIVADCYFLGRGCEKSESMMFEWLERAARRGSIEAVAKLAYCYEYGVGCRPDAKKAHECYVRAAKAELPMAMAKMEIGRAHV